MPIIDELNALVDQRIRETLPAMVEAAIRVQMARMLGVNEPAPYTNGSAPAPVAPKRMGRPPKAGGNAMRSVLRPAIDELSAKGHVIYAIDKNDKDKSRQAQKHVIEVIAAQPDGEMRGMGAAQKTGFSQGYFRYVVSKLMNDKVVKVSGTKLAAVYSLDAKNTKKWLSKNSEPPQTGFEDVSSVEVVD